MKYECGIIKDLMPLHLDKICSEESKTAGETHLTECESCRDYYAELSEEAVEVKLNEQFETQQEKSLKNVKKKWRKTKWSVGIIGIIIGVIIMYITLLLTVGVGSAGLMYCLSVSAQVEVYEDIENYNDYISSSDTKYGFCGERASLFPEEITEDMKVKDFRFVYYNPFDAQYLTYLTVEYDKEQYEAELARLSQFGVESYEGIYSVSGEPEGYDLVAMNSDSYEGFVYAMIPENSAGNDRTVTYVGIIFCNYFLDLDINDYVPEEYLLSGFDASEGNPYRKKMMNEY